MEVIVFDGEKYERGKRWFILFFTFFALVVLFSFFARNILGTLLLFLFMGGYLLFSFVNHGKKTKISLSEEGLRIGIKNYPWTSVTGFVLELDSRTQKLKNIVLLVDNLSLIHTFDDQPENIKQFVMALGEIVPMASGYNQTFLEKIIRKFKI